MAEHSSFDEVLGRSNETAAIARSALEWIDDEANERKLVLEKAVMQRTFRRDLVEAERLAKSVSRPTCIGIFGPSQAGKSYLVSSLAGKEANRLIATFSGDRPEIDFVTQINPAGGKEATGLVTRFTIKSETSPPGFPVSLRLLSQIDIVKILANSFYNDGSEEHEPPLEPDVLEQHIETFRQKAGSEPVDSMREQDVWDIEEYFKKSWRSPSHPSRQFDRHWESLVEIAPLVPITDRAELFSVLWGRHPEFTKLFIKLATALKALNFADSAFTSLDALVPSAIGILNVETLSGLNEDHAETIDVVTSAGAVTKLSRPVVTAIAAELRIVCRDKSWDFLEDTDILDFPGYRSRSRTNLWKYFEESKDAIKELFLRAKVDYLFQRYTSDLELTCLVMCLRADPLEVASLPEAIEDWIEVTHGGSAEQRASRPTLLFLALTFFDVHLIDKASDEENDATVRFQARLDSSLLQRFGRAPTSWPRKWKPGKPFDNCYWIRNPNVEARHVLEYDSQKREARIIPEREQRLAELREGHNSASNIRTHFKDPDRAWSAALQLNDGGVSYLAEGLGAVCSRQLKLDQINARLEDLRQRMRGLLEKYYVPEDLEKRLKERRLVAASITAELSTETATFGTLLNGFCVHEPDLYVAILDELFRPARAKEGGDKFDGKGKAEPKSLDRCAQLARKAIQFWTEFINERASDPAFARQVSVSNANLLEIAAELWGAARLWDLGSVIEKRMRPLMSPVDTPETLARRTAVIAEHYINAFVCCFDIGQARAEQHKNGWGSIFVDQPTAYEASGISYEPKDFKQEYVHDWIKGLLLIVDENASSKDGLIEDPIQNAKLGRILAGLGVQTTAT